MKEIAELPDSSKVDPAKIPYGQTVMTLQGMVCSTAPAPKDERHPLRHKPPVLAWSQQPKVVGSQRIEMPAQERALVWIDPTHGECSRQGGKCERILEQIVERCPDDELARIRLVRTIGAELGMLMSVDLYDKTSPAIAGAAAAELATLRDRIYQLRHEYNESMPASLRVGEFSDIRLKKPAHFNFALVKRLSWLLGLHGMRLLPGVTNVTLPGINGSKSIELLLDHDRGTVMSHILQEAWRITGLADKLGLMKDSPPPPEAA